MEEFFSYGRKGIIKFIRENRVSILYTLIFHLVILIILIFARVEGLKRDRELGIELEFEDKTVEEILAEEEVELPAEWIEQIMRQREQASNRAVNIHAEDRFSNEISTREYVEDILEQIELARKQEDRQKLEELQAILAAADYVPPPENEQDDGKSEFSGPTTITYEFLGDPKQRGKVVLTIPVYRCLGSGLVKVEVIVGRDGTVLDADIREPVEGDDQICFKEAALAAALTSRFRIDLNAPERHRALITYKFIAQ